MAKLSLKERLQQKREKANEKNKKAPTIPFESTLYLFGENATVKLLRCLKSNEDMYEVYKTIIKADVNGEKINETFGQTTVNKITYNSPKTNGGTDEIELYRKRCWKELSETEAKKATENSPKPKPVNWVLADIISHPDRADERVVIPFNAHMMDFMMDNLLDTPISELIKTNDKIHIKTDKYTMDDAYLVKELSDSTITCDDTIKDVEMDNLLIINGIKFTFSGISGNTFTGVKRQILTEDDIFGWEGEYLLELSAETQLDGNYHNYSVNSEFKHISKVKGISSVTGAKKYSDIRDIEKIKKDIPFSLTDAGGQIQTYEQSYFKFHKYFLREDDETIKKALAEIKKSNPTVDNTSKKEKDVKEPEVTEAKSEPKVERPTKLNIADEDFETKTDFEKKMEDVKEPIDTINEVTSFSLDDMENPFD